MVGALSERCKKKPEDLKKINLAEALFHFLDWEKQNVLNSLAPQKIEVPSGSEIKIQYFANGATPVLSVRLQEVFGLKDTPVLKQWKNKSGHAFVIARLQTCASYQRFK